MDAKNPTNHIVIPLGQALITALFSTLASYALGQSLEWTAPGPTALTVGAIVGLFSWLRLMGDTRQDGAVHEPSEAIEPVYIVNEARTRGVRLSDLWNVIDRESFSLLCQDLTQNGKAFTLANFGGYGKILTRGQFEALRSLLLSRDCLRWRQPGNPNRGVEWTRPGTALVKYFAEPAAPPTLVDWE